MPWRPLPRIAFAIATHPFEPVSSEDLPLELGDELYIIEEGGNNLSWLRGYLVAPPSILAGLTSVKGRTLEARVFSGVFPRACVTIRDYLESPTEEKDIASTIRSARSSTPQAEDESDDEGSICPDDSASQISISENSKNGHVRVIRKASKPPISPVEELQPSPKLNHESGNRKPPAPVPMLKIADDCPASRAEPLVDEIASCLREWYSTNLHELTLSRKYKEIEKLSKLQKKLDNARRQMQTGSLTKQELNAVREKTVWALVKGNKMLSNEVIVRDPLQGGRLLTGDDDPLHVSKLQAQMSLLKKPILQTTEEVLLHHLLFELKDANVIVQEKVSLYVSLYTKEGSEPIRPLTEPYLIEIAAGESARSNTPNKLRTLFKDLAASDIGATRPFGTNVYLVIKAQTRATLPALSIAPNSIYELETVTLESSSSAGRPRRSLMFGSKAFGGTRPKPKLSTQTSITESVDSVDSPIDKVPSDGRSGSESGIITPKPRYRVKDIGYAMVPINDISHFSSGIDKSIDMWSLDDSLLEGSSNDTEQEEQLNELFGRPGGSFMQSKSLSHLRLRLQSFQHHDAEDLIRANPTILHDTMRSQKIGFSGVPDQPRSDIYLTVILAHLPQNGLFSHPTRGAIPMDNSLAQGSLMLTLEVKTTQGQIIPDCISDAANGRPSTSWQSALLSRNARWSQPLRLTIPKDQVIDCHVLMTISDSQDTTFGLSYIPLWHDGAFVSDGSHQLLIYQNDSMINRVMGGNVGYTHLGWNSKTRDNRQSWSDAMATMHVRTDLVSTIFSQNQVLLNVLNWKDRSDEDLIRLLSQLRNVPDLELVKFVSDVLDALFGILVQRNGNDEFEDLIFGSVVDILTIAQSKRFNLTPVIAEYANGKFDFPFAAPCLMRSFLRLILRRSDDRGSRQLRATLKVGRQVLKFILQARKQQIQKEEYIGINNTSDEVFLREIKKLFQALEDQMRDPTPSSIGTKTLLVQHVHTWLPDLLSSFGQRNTARLAIGFIESCSNITGKLILHKLVFMWNLIKLSRSWEAPIRESVETQVEEWMSPFWGSNIDPDEQYREQVRLCASIISLWNGQYGKRTISFYYKILQSFLSVANMPMEKPGTFSLLFPTTYPFPSKPTESPRDYDECLIELAALKATFTPQVFADHREEVGARLDILITALRIDTMIIQGKAFPKSWITLHAFYHRVEMSLLQMFTELAPISGFVPPPEDSDAFNLDLWKSFLDTLLVVVRSDALALESLPEQRRKAVWKTVGDLRETGARLLTQNWHSLGWPTDQDDRDKYHLSRLGGYQVQYVPSLVGPIVELCLSVHEGLRTSAVEVLRSMIIAEYELNADIDAIRVEMVRTLNELFKTKNIADSAAQKLFIDQLLDGFKHLQESDDDGIWQVCNNLVLAIDELLDLLIVAHAPGQHESLRIVNTLALLDFLRGIQKDDIFIEYAHQLADVEAKERNYQEAGLALKLHADLYAWDLDTKLEELKTPSMPTQTAFERKEDIYMQMIEYFEKGCAWTAAMDCYLELAHEYQHTTFNYSKLAKAQHSMARIHDSIAKDQGEVPRYFHVEFTGLGFPPTLKNKAFIYEGISTQRLAGFNDRLQKQFPTAKLLDASAQDDIEEAEGQYIKIGVLQVHINLDQPILRRSKVSLSTKEYVLSTKPRQFSTTIQKYPSTDPGTTEVDKLVFETAEPFPTILRRSQVISQRVVRLSPIETAIERILRKTFELKHLAKRVPEDNAASLKILADAIKSQVDPASKGSVTIYRPLLENHQSAQTESTSHHDNGLTQSLQISLLDFASLLRGTIPLLQGTKYHLEYKNNTILFQQTFEPELSLLASMNPSVLSNGNGEIDPSAYTMQSQPGKVVMNGHAEGTGIISTRATPGESIDQRSKASRPVSSTSSQIFLGSSGDAAAMPPPAIPTRPTPKSSNRQSWRSGLIPVSSEEPVVPTIPRSSKDREVVASERPKTGHSTASQSMGQSSLKSTTGSLRKRLSTFGLGSRGKGKKAVKAVDRVREEE